MRKFIKEIYIEEEKNLKKQNLQYFLGNTKVRWSY